MEIYFWQNKEQGYLIPETALFDDACLTGYYDVIDPSYPDYLNFEKYYTKTNKRAN